MTTLRALIFGDSPRYAAALRRTLEHDGDISVEAFCGGAEDALAALRTAKPDLIALDMRQPETAGLRAVEEIMSSRPLPILVLLSASPERQQLAAAALAAGALDTVAREDLNLADPAGPDATALRQRVRTLGRVRVIRHPRAHLRSATATRYASVIGVCGSTGGPQALAQLLEVIPADYPIPILVVQHISDGFTDGLVQWLNHVADLPVAIAPDGERVAPGVWIAPEHAHLMLTITGRFRLDATTVAGRHRPSGDVLFSSLATVARSAAVAVVLSGMGYDGSAGAAEVLRQGGLAMAQDEQSSVIFGMPWSAISNGVDLVLPPAGIASQLLRLRPRRLGRSR